MKYSFVKMHSIGNDFVIINALHVPFAAKASTLIHLGNRHTGIGCDQILIVETSNKADFLCRIYNTDGSQAEQCGNGLRCLAYYLFDSGLVEKKIFTIETIAGVFKANIEGEGRASIELGMANIIEPLLQLNYTENTVPITVLTLGNPHAVICLNDIDLLPNQILADQIATSAIFPHGANVGFMNILNPSHIQLQTYERGAGKTLACGSNACAAVAAGIVNRWLENKVEVEFELGSVKVFSDPTTNILTLSGPVSFIFEGTTF